MSLAAASPVYVVIDVSASMSPHIRQLNNSIVQLVDNLQMNLSAADAVHLSLISFADDAHLELPLTHLAEIDNLPSLAARGATSYGPALRLLRDSIARDVNHLKLGGYRVYRPMVFFMSDGAPIDSLGWQRDLRHLKEKTFSSRPVIFALGIGSADPASIRSLASGPSMAFVSGPNVSPEGAIDAFLHFVDDTLQGLTKSITTAGSGVTVSPPSQLVPIPIEVNDA